jgi:hypothetical protein
MTLRLSQVSHVTKWRTWPLCQREDLWDICDGLVATDNFLSKLSIALEAGGGLQLGRWFGTVGLHLTSLQSRCLTAPSLLFEFHAVSGAGKGTIRGRLLNSSQSALGMRTYLDELELNLPAKSKPTVGTKQACMYLRVDNICNRCRHISLSPDDSDQQ